MTIFRVGDFSLDGYPDLIVTLKTEGKAAPRILENVEYADGISFKRLFIILGFLNYFFGVEFLGVSSLKQTLD